MGGGRWQLFTQKTYRKRLLLALMIAIGGQNAGMSELTPTVLRLQVIMGVLRYPRDQQLQRPPL